MRTFAEAERRNNNNTRMPADTYEMLKKNVTRYAMFLLALFVGENVHTTKVYGASVTLQNFDEANSHHFTIKYCWGITWAVIVDCCHFFHQHLMSSDNKDRVAQEVDFPISLLNLTTQAVRTFLLLTYFYFPYKWEITIDKE